MSQQPDEDVSSLFADQIDDERETVMISRVDQSETRYQISPAAFDTVIVRVVTGAEDEPRSVEALLKGSFPEGCTELHQIIQEAAPDGQVVELTMRRPESAICTQVVRPYRFFFELERKFTPGRYVLTVNGRTFPFVVE